MDKEASPRILIVDDDEDLLRALSARLSSCGYHCVTAASAEEGLEQFRLGRIDLLITDLIMPPSEDGLGLLVKIREVSSVPVIVVSGFADERPAFVTKFAKVTFFRKPFDWQRLIELVEAELAWDKTATR